MSAVPEIASSIVGREAGIPEILRGSPVAFAMLRNSGKISAFNTAFEQLIGLDSRRASCFFVDLISPQSRGEALRLLSELFQGRREHFEIEPQSAGSKDHLLRWRAWRISAIEESACALLMVEDVSDIAAAEQHLRQAQRLETMGRLAGGVAHDFNNMLTGVLLYCDLMLSVLEPGHRGRAYAEEIRQAGLQATGLARQLLSLSRPVKASPNPISLNEVAEGFRNLLVRLIGENIDLKLQLDSALGLVKIDPTHAQQILLNLVLNARDAMPQGGRIVVETGNCRVQVLPEREGSNPILPCALFTVSDNGNGMDESVRARLFEPFFTTKAGKGTGIGMATVHDIVTSNGGLLHVDSKPGCGTRISVLLPLVPDSIPEIIRSNDFHPVNHRELLSFHTEDSTL